MQQRLQPPDGSHISDTSVPPRHVFDWNTIRCRLLWYYQGPPNTQSGTFETVNFIAWRIIRGGVDVAAANCRVHAGAGEWVVMAHNLGRRHQTFSADARIESLHLGIDTQPAEWTGTSIVVLSDSVGLRRAAAAVGRHVLARSPAGFMPGGHVFMSRDFAEQIQVKKQVWSFLAELGPLLAQAGMFICEPDYCEPRVVASLAQIDKWPVNLAWTAGRSPARRASARANLTGSGAKTGAKRLFSTGTRAGCASPATGWKTPPAASRRSRSTSVSLTWRNFRLGSAAG